MDNKREASESIESDNAKKQKTEDSNVNTIVKQRREKLPIDANEEPFIFIKEDNAELQKCWDFYEVSDDFAKNCTLVRNATGEPLRSIYYVAPVIKKILQNNDQKLRFIYTGIKLFVSQKSDVCPWRIQNECLNVIRPFLPASRQLEINLDLLKLLLLEASPSVVEIRNSKADPKFMEDVASLGEGSCFVKIKTDIQGGEELFFPLWKGKSSFNLMVNKHETAELLYRLYNIDKAALDKQKAEEKAAKEAAEERSGADADGKTAEVESKPNGSS